MENQQSTPSSKSKRLADCVVMAIFTVILVLAACFVPLLGVLAMASMAAPGIILVVREPLPVALLTLLVALGCCTLLGGVGVGAAVLIPLLALVLTYGLCFRHRCRPGRTLLYGTLVVAAAMGLSLGLLIMIGGFSFEPMLEGFRDGLENAVAVYSEAGVLDQILSAGQSADDYIEAVLSLFQRMLPALTGLVVLLLGVGNYLVSLFVLKRMQIDVPRPVPFIELHFSWLWLWGVIIALAAFLMGRIFGHSGYTDIAFNITCLYIPFALVAGISITLWMLRRRHVSNGVITLIFIGCLLLTQFSVPFFTVLGIFDMAVDYRRLLRKRDKQRQLPPRN